MKSELSQQSQADKTRCSCGEKAIYNRRYSGQLLCKRCFNNYFEKKSLDTIRQYKMTKPGEKIGIGLSGGKDSTVLLHIMEKHKNKLGISLHPITVDEGIEGYREKGTASALKTCQNLKINLATTTFKETTGHTLDEMLREGDLKACTYCGVIRRKLLNQSALELGLDKLATGHNLDDEAQVIIMNYLTGDIDRMHRLNSTASNKDLVQRIKPLKSLPEKEIMLYALINNLEISSDECPYHQSNHRTKVRDFINNLETDKPTIKFQIIKGWEKIISKTQIKKQKLTKCIQCGQPTSQDKCRACTLMEEIKIKRSEDNMQNGGLDRGARRSL